MFNFTLTKKNVEKHQLWVGFTDETEFAQVKDETIINLMQINHATYSEESNEILLVGPMFTYKLICAKGTNSLKFFRYLTRLQHIKFQEIMKIVKRDEKMKQVELM